MLKQPFIMLLSWNTASILAKKRVQNPVKSLDFKKSDDIQVQKPNTT